MTQRVNFDIVDGGISVDMQVAGDAEAMDFSVEPAGKGTTDYTELENKPSIEGVTLTGDVSLEDIGAADAEDVQAAQETAEAALTASGKAVRFDAAQTLTDAQKAQARGNIAAADAADVSELKSAFDDLEQYVRDLSPVVTAGPAPVVSVSDAAPLNAEDVVISIKPVQSGSGDPSPENVRPITGWTGANLFHGADQTDYDTYFVAFPTAAGTVYGGTLDLTAGTLTVTEFGHVFDGTENIISPVRNNLAMISFPGVTFMSWANGSIRGSSHFIGVTTSYGWGSVGENQWLAAGGSYFGFGGYTKEEFKAYAAAQYANGTPITCYTTLATPVTYTLDPVTLTLLRGNNVLWADTGDTTLTYRQDVATLLSALTAPDETDMTANANYAVNSFFTVGGTLYKATAAIATGETIVPGSNCVATTIADQLTYLYTQI